LSARTFLIIILSLYLTDNSQFNSAGSLKKSGGVFVLNRGETFISPNPAGQPEKSPRAACRVVEKT